MLTHFSCQGCEFITLLRDDNSANSNDPADNKLRRHHLVKNNYRKDRSNNRLTVGKNSHLGCFNPGQSEIPENI